MPARTQTTLEPRKLPVQARSTASVDAMLKATLQVLLKVGKERLTTSRVAQRAGVSVGTLYQYFPNKSALLRAALQQHMDEVGAVFDEASRDLAGAPLETIATELASRFLAAKMRDGRTSVALYAVSSDVDGARIAQEMSRKSHRVILDLLLSSSDKLTADPHTVASMLLAMMAGVSRRILEATSPEADFETLRAELLFLTRNYVRACTQPR